MTTPSDGAQDPLLMATQRQILGRLLPAVIAVALPISVLCDRLEFVATPSVPFRFAFEAFGPIHKGDYVRLPVVNPHINEGHASSLTKRIACWHGDVLTWDGQRHYCNGLPIDSASSVDLVDGSRVEPFAFNGVIPDGYVYVLGTHPQSFDSRYLGLLDGRQSVKLWGLL